MNIRELLENTPIIAAVKIEEELQNALNSEVEIVFVLYGNIINISDISKKVKEKDKVAVIHIDLVEGLANKEVAIKFIKEFTDFDGIISTKPALIRIAKANGLIAIQRMFISDSISLENAKNHMSNPCDALEILPGIIPKVITELSQKYDKPVVAGGLISNKDDVISALSAGAACVSTSKQEIWTI